MRHGMAIEGAFAFEMRPLAVEGQRDHLTRGQRQRRAAPLRLREGLVAQQIIHHHVQLSQQGVRVDQGGSSYLEGICLPSRLPSDTFRSLWSTRNSHQAFKCPPKHVSRHQHSRQPVTAAKCLYPHRGRSTR